MNIPNEATEAAVRALFEDGCGEPKVDASTALEAAYKFIAAQALRDEADKLDAWCGAQRVNTKDVSAELRNQAEKLEGR